MPRSERNTRATIGTYDWYQQELGRYLYTIRPGVFPGGPDIANWSAADREAVFQMIQMGEAEFYHNAAHEWSFFRPEFTLTTVADTEDYTMDADFAGIVGGDLEFDQTDSAIGSVVKVDPSAIRDRRSVRTVDSGYPTMYAQEVIEHTGTAEQRYQLLFWPNPDAVYTLRGQAIIEPTYMSESRQYPYGGTATQQVLLLAMKMVAARDYKADPRIAIESYQERLLTAVQQDAHRNAPHLIGYNGNDMTSGRALSRKDLRRWDTKIDVTYEGNSFDGD